MLPLAGGVENAEQDAERVLVDRNTASGHESVHAKCVADCFAAQRMHYGVVGVHINPQLQAELVGEQTQRQAAAADVVARFECLQVVRARGFCPECPDAACDGCDISAVAVGTEELVDGYGVVLYGLYDVHAAFKTGVIRHGRCGGPLRDAVLHERVRSGRVGQYDDGAAQPAAATPVDGPNINLAGVQLERMLREHGHCAQRRASAEVVD